MRQAILLLFCEPLPAEWVRLKALKSAEWTRLLQWLDTSGLALYFLDRMKQLNLCVQLPGPVLSHLLQNHADNTLRTNAMIADCTALQQRFQQAGITYALLKGFSLWPESVPDLTLRSQIDLDFLVAQKDALVARKILHDHGYCLHAISGRSWEFKSTDGPPALLADLYKPGHTRSVEIHLEAAPEEQPGSSSLLNHTQSRSLHGIDTPVLAPVDLFLGQGLHLYKHLSSEFLRTAHILEFRNHIRARSDDPFFWQALQLRTRHDPYACIKLGVVILFIACVLDDGAPASLTSWTVDTLPANVVRWVRLYAYRIALTSFPGSKLYLLLQQELEVIGLPGKRSLRQSLLPRSLPPAIAHPVVNETSLHCIRRHLRQLLYILFRLRFHAVQGVAYLCESIRWRAVRNGIAQ